MNTIFKTAVKNELERKKELSLQMLSSDNMFDSNGDIDLTKLKRYSFDDAAEFVEMLDANNMDKHIMNMQMKEYVERKDGFSFVCLIYSYCIQTNSCLPSFISQASTDNNLLMPYCMYFQSVFENRSCVNIENATLA